jgi:hypothetical protein
MCPEILCARSRRGRKFPIFLALTLAGKFPLLGGRFSPGVATAVRRGKFLLGGRESTIRRQYGYR